MAVSLASHPTNSLLEGLAEARDGSTSELRVRISHDLHRRLMALKLLRGQSLGDSINAALALYFAEHAQGGNVGPV